MSTQPGLYLYFYVPVGSWRLLLGIVLLGGTNVNIYNLNNPAVTT